MVHGDANLHFYNFCVCVHAHTQSTLYSELCSEVSGQNPMGQHFIHVHHIHSLILVLTEFHKK